MDAKRLYSLVAGILCFIVMGLAWGESTAQSAVPTDFRSAGAARAISGPANSYDASRLPVSDISASVPLTTPTPTPQTLPDLVSQMNWIGSCPNPVLRLATRNLNTPIPVPTNSTMSLSNSYGERIDVPVPSTFGSEYAVYKDMGTCQSCIPLDWLCKMPFTLTADYGNTVTESNETNNSSVMTTLPPACDPCGKGTVTATATPDPEYRVLRYVADNNPDWTCEGPFGTPGHRYLNDCNPFGLFSHPTSGYMDRYNSPAEAQAAWQTRRDSICPTFPICMNTSYAEFNGYEAGNTNYPTAHYESYYPASVWLVGAVSSDDTQFRGAPHVSDAIIEAARALGYLGGGTVTPSATPTRSPTVWPTNTTGVPYDLTGHAQWSSVCPAPVLQLRTNFASVPSQTAGPSVMRITNSAGDTRDFQLPAIPANTYYQYDCVLGDCVPSNWGTLTPITLTVDILNQVVESNEGNNNYVLLYPPPMPTPCNITPTNTPTGTRTVTPSATIPACIDPNPPDLVPLLDWGDTCPAPTLHVTTRSQYPEIYFESSVMRLTNSAGDYREWTVPAILGPGSYTVDCQIGTCVPTNWLNALPYTLTVDYYNNVCEYSELNNTLTFSATPPPCPGCPRFTDVPPDHTFYSSVECLACRGIINGYPCGQLPNEPCNENNDPYYRPGNGVTRGQLSKIVVLATGWQGSYTEQYFTDVPVGSTFYTYTARLYDQGYIQGYPCGGPGEPCDPDNRPYFRVGNGGTRGQIAKIVAQSAGFNDPIPPDQQTFEDVPPGSTFWLWIEQLAGRSVIAGYPCGGVGEPCGPENRPYFRPNNLTTRGQLAKIVQISFFPSCYTP